jgi:ankyrin repeat protein
MPLDREGRNPLHYAAANGQLDELLRLIEGGEDASLPDRSGFTPLHFAAIEGQPEAIALLLGAAAEVDPQDKWGDTPLWRAVFNTKRRAECVALLLDAGANPDLDNASGVSPRALAARMGAFDLIPSR